MIALAVHGGAGGIRPERLAADHERAARRALEAALAVGRDVLAGGGDALLAVQRAVEVLEDDPVFNAGRGSVLRADGCVAMDASIMDGRTRAAGAVAGVERIVHPIRAARAVMDHTPHVLLVADHAEAFARTHGIATADPADFVTDARREQLARARARAQVRLDYDDAGGTVGAVARDERGHLAAATSTGGMTNQLPGRVGDTPLIGAGTWADDATCAVSGTGHGEAFIRNGFAHEVDAQVRLAGATIDDACRLALERVRAAGSGGGCIAVGGEGPPTLRFTTTGMFRGWLDAGGQVQTAVFGT